MKQSLLPAVCLLLGAGLGAHAADKPSDILDLSRWKLTLPHARPGEKKPVEIHQPELAAFEKAECFFADPAGRGVVFRAHCTDTTTKSSKYPRCELREMAGGGNPREKARWGTDDGLLHRMTLVQAITAVPPVKRHVVAGQIHDADDDVLMIRLEDRKLFVERNQVGDVLLDKDYALGTRFTLRIEAHAGRIRVWYDGALKMDWKHPRDGCYFKAGCYTQSNTSKGDTPESYGEVVITRLHVEHVRPEGPDDNRGRE
jgi:poly(beta-D-mannuronate) lyase